MATIPKAPGSSTPASGMRDATRTPGPLQQQAGEGNRLPAMQAATYRSTDGFFVSDQPPDNGARWSKLYPYQLMMLYANDNGGYGVVDRYTLPISPMDLAVRTPFAIQTTVTLKGILEEHNAAPLRQISFSGTTGVWPFRRTAQRASTPGIVETIAAGTISAAQTTASSFRKIFSGVSLAAGNILSAPESEEGAGDMGLQGTGYWQFHLLQVFLERYAMVKKGNAYKDPKFNEFVKDPSRLRLAFAMWKDNWVWLVTPRSFTLNRSSSDPMVYRYSFEGTAWKRIDLAAASPSPAAFSPAPRDVNKMQRALNSLRQARRTLQDAKATIAAVRADVDASVFDNIRESILFLKEFVGIPPTLMDMPKSIARDFQSTVVDNWEGLRQSLPDSVTVRQDPSNPTPLGKLFETSRGEQRGQPSARASLSDTADPLNKIFADPDANPDLFDGLEIAAMDTPLELQNRVDAERDRASALVRTDFLRIHAGLQSVSDDLAEHLGMASATYNRVKGLPPPRPSTHQATPEEMEALYALQQSCQEIDRLTATLTLHEDTVPDSFEYVKGLADAAGVDFDIPNGKYAVPLPFGYTMEQLSAQYLGDPDRWMEIVTLNGLQPPFVDEDGFLLPMLSNGSGNQVQVGSADNLYAGQSVRLSSSSVPAFKRHLVRIETVSPGSVLLTLDGDPTLDSLTVADHATVKAFLPGTINSEQLVFIPSQARGPDDNRTVSISSEAEADSLTRVSKIDFLLDSKGDVVVTKSGEVRLAYGLTNLVQAARLKVSTPRGSLLHYPSYGFAVEPGTSVADITAEQVLQSIRSTFAGDERFTGVEAVEVKISGPSMVLNILVGAAGSATLLPVSIQMSEPS